MSRIVHRIRRPVRREGGETFLLFTLLSFGASVALTRLFLELTGYPQLGGSTLHIAHVLWGGLFLFIAALLPLIFANRWVYNLGAIMAGLGVGLFIDEVGKFITQNNDYFFPAAAPIVYAFFLITVFIYLQLRRPGIRDARAELYAVLDFLEEVLDRDLEPQERDELKKRLEYVSRTTDRKGLKKLADALLEFVSGEELYLAPQVPSLLERMEIVLETIEDRWITKSRLRAVLVGGLLALGIAALMNLGRLILGLRAPESLETWLVEWIQAGKVMDARGLIWFLTRIGIEGASGLLLLLAAGLYLLRREGLATAVATLSLILTLTVTNLIVFYFEQFSTILPAVVQLLIFLGVLRYRRRYVIKRWPRYPIPPEVDH